MRSVNSHLDTANVTPAASTSPAERLMDVGRAIKFAMKCQCQQCATAVRDMQRHCGSDYLQLATSFLELSRRDPAAALPALVEDWSQQEISALLRSARPMNNASMLARMHSLNSAFASDQLPRGAE